MKSVRCKMMENNLITAQILFISLNLFLSRPFKRSIEVEHFPFDFAIGLLSIYDKENVIKLGGKIYVN
jgi:hypothetical protein